jgi:hypothetical protein
MSNGGFFRTGSASIVMSIRATHGEDDTQAAAFMAAREAQMDQSKKDNSVGI